MPASTRQQSEAEERAATSAALEAAEEQAAQAAAAEQAAQDALGLERLAREEAEKAQAALEKRLAELESGFESAASEEEAAAEEEAGPALSADAILRKFADARTKGEVSEDEVQWALEAKNAERALAGGGPPGGSNEAIIAQLLEQQASLQALVAQGAAREARLEENLAKVVAKLDGSESEADREAENREFVPPCEPNDFHVGRPQHLQAKEGEPK
eukprot:COSAG06_NODE_3318_length_5510_cov_54.390622_2_plen_216_part_00